MNMTSLYLDDKLVIKLNKSESILGNFIKYEYDYDRIIVEECLYVYLRNPVLRGLDGDSKFDFDTYIVITQPNRIFCKRVLVEDLEYLKRL